MGDYEKDDLPNTIKFFRNPPPCGIYVTIYFPRVGQQQGRDLLGCQVVLVLVLVFFTLVVFIFCTSRTGGFLFLGSVVAVVFLVFVILLAFGRF